MAIGCWEKFTGTNWERYADLCGGLTAVLLIFFSIMTWLFKYNTGVGVYTFFVGLFVLFFETPILSWIGPLGKCRDSCNEGLYYKQPGFRAIVYIVLSILTLAYKTPCIGGGIFLLFTAILKLFAQANVVSDAADQSNINKGLAQNAV